MSDAIPITIDANTFQFPLAELATTLVHKVEREGTPDSTNFDLAVLLRSSTETVNFLYYLNADDRVESDCTFRPIYTVVTSPLVRNIIDNFYNITLILSDPSRFGREFRSCGIRKTQRNLAEDEVKYKGRPEWDSWIADSRAKLSLYMRSLGIAQSDVDNAPDWMTLGKYLSQKGPGGSLSPHQQLLSNFLYGPWREYSALAHGAPEALMNVGMFYRYKEQPFDDRPKIDDSLSRLRDVHIMRASIVLLATITELQAFFHFRDAHIDSRLHRVWAPILVYPEAKELHDRRYAQLMMDKGILP